jgi:phosphoribosyl 1,2-cyclic phosphate phosphodiesterase
VELTLLGTAAAEGYPALACGCANCDAARRRGGRNLRKRSHALLDGRLLLDLGPDLLWSVQQFGLELHRLGYVLLTHGHSDHLLLSNLRFRGPGFVPGELAPWELCGSAASLATVAALPELAELRLTLRPVAAFETFPLGPYTVTALPARHDPAQSPLFYAIRQGEAALLYATDSGPWFDETWAALEDLGRAGVRFGAAVIEATSGVVERPAGAPPGVHMNFAETIAHARGLRERGLLRPDAAVVAHHFSHNGAPPHEETAAFLAPAGIVPAYDGMVVTA